MASADSATEPSPPRRRRPFRWLWLVTLPLLLLGWWLVTAEPAYWRTIDPQDPDAGRLAESFESRVASAVTRVRPETERWAVEVTQEELNVWLATRLPLWLDHHGVELRGLEAGGAPVMALLRGRAELALRPDAAVSGTVRLLYRPVPSGGEGPVHLELQGVRLGRLPLPADRILLEVEGLMGETSPIPPDALRSLPLRLGLGDGRHVEVVRVELERGRALLHCRTRRDR